MIQHLNIGAEIKGLYRKDIYEIPTEILRELVVNAVMHRNYLLNSYIQVSIFDDRVEIVSPGGLFGGLTIKDILDGRSSIRNEILADVFLKMKLVEHWGTGLKRISSICQENGIEMPTYKADFSFFSATIKRNISAKVLQSQKSTSLNVPSYDPLTVPLNDRESQILKILAKNPRTTAREISQKLSVAEKTIKRDFENLKRHGLIERQGSKKSGSWSIISIKA